MGYLDNTSITVDAILTKRGRELLSRNDGSFQITQFALGDDEIDYSLFNENHPNGTQFSAEAIENMPLIEAIPNGANMMNSKLITLGRGALSIPYIEIPGYGDAQSMTTITLTGGVANPTGVSNIVPQTNNYSGGTEDYVFTVLNDNLVSDFTAGAGLGDAQDLSAVLNEFTTIETAFSVRGSSLSFIATDSPAHFSGTVTSRTTSIIVEGVSSGGIVSIPVTINYGG